MLPSLGNAWAYYDGNRRSGDIEQKVGEKAVGFNGSGVKQITKESNMEFLFGMFIGLVIGVLACYAWQKGLLKEAGVK